MKLEIYYVSDNLASFLEVVGEDKFLEITKLYGGNNLYIPTYSSVIRESRNKEIRKKFNGVNAQFLAREYGISVNHIKKIINK